MYCPTKEREQIGVSPAEGAVRFLAGEPILFRKVKKDFTATGGFQKIPARNYADKEKKFSLNILMENILKTSDQKLIQHCKSAILQLKKNKQTDHPEEKKNTKTSIFSSH